MLTPQYSPEIQAVVDAWKPYIDSMNDWQALTNTVKPKVLGCGPVYELANPLNRPNEDFAMCDMRGVPFAEPHYHPAGNWEIYFVLQGTATIVLGTEERPVAKGEIIVIAPDIAHFTIPDANFVIAMVNTPPFRPENYITLTRTNPDVQFDYEQFKQLTRS